MKRFRILTTDDEWLYTDLNVLDNCIRCPLMDENGTQVTDPRVRLKPETLGQLIDSISDRLIYEGDIVKVNSEPQLMLAQMSEYVLPCLVAKNRDRIFNLIELVMKVIGNIHQNPELLEE